jgi:hypothetical protein
MHIQILFRIFALHVCVVCVQRERARARERERERGERERERESETERQRERERERERGEEYLRRVPLNKYYLINFRLIFNLFSVAGEQYLRRVPLKKGARSLFLEEGRS